MGGSRSRWLTLALVVATLEREITPFLTGAVQDPLRLLGAIDYVIQERERQRLIAAHQAAAAAPQRR